jgi:long-chain acyl-CoA synthetase
VDIYFLEDLFELARALPIVRPSMFFSVPRIYEKVWAGLSRNRMGRLYLALREGLVKRALRPLLRRSLLSKAGMDCCAQLLVGSAPAAETVLRGFHELGIEIHNAYGLSEAPLVTLNRLGANRLGTVGVPLPDTQVRVADDGEVLVKGPQVTAGYYQEEAVTPFREGWLLTGDLGHITDEGSLAIDGRKKELIKTSYGKYVHPAKIEALLREIPGVAEALLVGEERPYCAALLWVDAERRDPAATEATDRAIVAMNTRLSHPEQVKRWAVLAHDLSVERGDLTANLKLKRHAVAQRHQRMLDALYDRKVLPEDVLHVGQADR